MAQWPVEAKLAGLGLLDSGSMPKARAQAATGDYGVSGYGEMLRGG